MYQKQGIKTHAWKSNLSSSHPHMDNYITEVKPLTKWKIIKALDGNAIFVVTII